MCEILCSTGALLANSNNRDYRLLKDLSTQLMCDGFEFMMYSTWYEEVDTLISTLRSMNLNIPVMHCEKHLGEAISKGEFDEAYRKFKINCNIAKEIGAGKIVVHLWDGLTSDAHFDNNLNAYLHLKNIADQYNIGLLIENVVCNRENPMKHWCELRDKYEEIRFVFDTKMAAFHDQLDLLYNDEYEWLWKDKHICHFHINDYAGGYKEWKKLCALPIGQGHIDFKNFFEFIRKIEYDGTFTTEAPALDSNGIIDIETLNKQFKYIREAVTCSQKKMLPTKQSNGLYSMDDLCKDTK